MDAELERLGNSLLVPSVQELAKESLTTVPLRYVRHDHQNCPISSYGARCPDDVPIIDMDKFISGDHMDSELKKLDYASREWVSSRNFITCGYKNAANMFGIVCVNQQYNAAE
ncbi:hypothetical protein ACSBR1_014683 [Camellia fascicularis]